MTTPITSGVLADRAVWRSWFSATAPPISDPAGSAARSRSIVRPTAGFDGSCLGIAVISAYPLLVCVGISAATPGSRLAICAAAVAWAAGVTICSGPVAPGPNARLDLVVADPG